MNSHCFNWNVKILHKTNVFLELIVDTGDLVNFCHLHLKSRKWRVMLCYVHFCTMQTHCSLWFLHKSLNWIYRFNTWVVFCSLCELVTIFKLDVLFSSWCFWVLFNGSMYLLVESYALLSVTSRPFSCQYIVTSAMFTRKHRMWSN